MILLKNKLNVLKLLLLGVIIWVLIFLFTNIIDNYFSGKNHEMSELNFEKLDTQVEYLNSEILKKEQNYKLSFDSKIKVKKYLINCGLSEVCPSDQFSLSLNTGFENKVPPFLCIDDKVFLDKDYNESKRGINVAIIDYFEKKIIKIINFDTYERESSIEIMLIKLKKHDIIIFLTYDEPSVKLSNTAKMLLNEIGSSNSQNIDFRSSWYLITFKGIKGYSPFEEINISQSDDWAKPLAFSSCIPYQFEGLIVKPDPSTVENKDRVKFCDKYSENFPAFCKNLIISDASLISYNNFPSFLKIIYVPLIVLVINCSAIYLPLLMETIVRQPNLNTSIVFVVYNPDVCVYVPKLIDLFTFQTLPVYSMVNLSVIINKIPVHMFEQMIIIEDNIVLSSNFLAYFSQLLHLLNPISSKISAISAWNENGFQNISGDDQIIYRVSNYPLRYAYMVKKDFDFNGVLLNTLPTEYQYNQRKENILIPDVSRVMYSSELQLNDTNLFGRMVCMEDVSLKNIVEISFDENYQASLLSLFENSIKFLDITSFIEFYTKEINDTEELSFAFISTSKSEWNLFCEFFKIPFCVPHQNVKSLGLILRFTIGPYKIDSMLIEKN